MREPHSHATDDPHWRCAPIPDDVRDRRVEITGPVDRKMVINGLNSGANVYMADFEGGSYLFRLKFDSFIFVAPVPPRFSSSC